MKKLFVLFATLSLLSAPAFAGGGDVESSKIIEQLTGLSYSQKANENGNYEKYMTVHYTTGGCNGNTSYELKLENLTMHPIEGAEVQELQADVSIQIVDTRERRCRRITHVSDTVNLTKLLAEKAAELNLRKKNTRVDVTLKTVPVITRELIDNSAE